MKRAHAVFLFLRNLFLYAHPYVASCALCHELSDTQRSERLCTSLQPDFPVDAVIFARDITIGKLNVSLSLFRSNAPWVQNIYVVTDHPRSSLPVNGSIGISPLLVSENPLSTSALEAFPHVSASLTEHYVVAFLPFLTNFRHNVQDLFTPNGIPLLITKNVCHPIRSERLFIEAMHTQGLKDERQIVFPFRLHPQNRKMASDFLLFYKKTGLNLSDEDFFAAQARWAYATGRAVVMRNPAA